MNLNEDFIIIQGILIAAEKKAGSLQKIKHRGGNEKHILIITAELHTFLSTKSYIKNEKINSSFDAQLKEICLFLILNTELNEPLDEPSLQHLINIAPQLSTCLLANIIVGLDLSRHYSEVLLQFNCGIVAQLLSEMIPCVKKCKRKVHIANSRDFLKLIVTKVSTTDSNSCEKLTDIAAQMLLDLTAIQGEELENVKIMSIYECMGLTLLTLLDLLLMCNENNPLLERLIQKLIHACQNIMMAVTLHVYCSWVEFEHENEALQIWVSGKSYLFIEKYQKYKHAKELISMLGSIAQKPKSVQEQIYSASASTMISMLNKSDLNQRKWFTALLNTQILADKDSLQCLERWAHLCTVDDVSRLLDMSVRATENHPKNVVVKCAASLCLEDLVMVTTRYLFQNGIKNNLNENVGQQLIVLFNKIKDKANGDEFCKELCLLLLQNPVQTLSHVFSECTKNTFYSCSLRTFWPCIREIIGIQNIGKNILENEIARNRPCEQNCQNYIQLLNAFIEAKLFTDETVAIDIILPLMQNAQKEQDFDLVRNFLEIFKATGGNILLTEGTEPVFYFLLDLMKTHRCNFWNFNGLRQEIVKLCVDIFENYFRVYRGRTYEGQGIKTEDFFVSFYKDRLFGKKLESDVLAHFFPISFENHAETVAHLIKILPLCVTTEWTMLTANLVGSCGSEKTTELLCDFMILLCELVNSQETKTEEVKCMFLALGYCLQNLGVVIKECIQPKISNLQEDVALTKNICRLLRDIPNGNLKSEEGLSLASLLSEFSLRSLRPDKKFACLVASIHEQHICKMLAQKILS